jgi:DNA-binding NarL/FixJ family response regulator
MTTVPDETGEHTFWERTRTGWHVAFYAALAAVVVFIQADPDLPTPERFAVVALTAFMAVSYTFLGRRILGAEQVTVPVVCYLLSVWLPFLVLIGIDPAAFVLLFVLMPQTFANLPTRAAVVWIVLATSAMFVTGLLSGRPPGQLAIESALNLGFTLLLGLWITGVINESENRAALIEELQTTRAQLAAAERERGALAERVDGAHATARIVSELPGTRVIVLTTYDTDADIVRAVEARAAGYLLKDSPRGELASAVRAAARGETVLAPPVAARLVNRIRRPTVDALTARETDVLRLVAQGLTNAEIGQALFIGEATVKSHLLKIFTKLDVDDRTRAVTVAMERGILPSPS